MNSSTTNRPNGYTYDPNWNMTVEPLIPQQNHMTYDGENRMTAVTGGAAASYTYDGNGTRIVRSVTGGATTVSIFSGSSVIAEYDNGAAPSAPSREYVYNGAGGDTTGLLAMIVGGTTGGGATTYYHQDHLSVRLTTDGTPGSPTYGQVLSQQGSYPYGEQWYQSGPGNKWFFTSYGRDSETGLDYALARYYDSRTGTFCSADPLAGDPSDPQSWNRYPYGRNNPIMVTDPSGQAWWSWLADIGIGIADLFPATAPFAEAATLQLGWFNTWMAISNGQSPPRIGFGGGGDVASGIQSALGLPTIADAVGPMNNLTQGPAGYTPCPSVNFLIKAPAPGQATTAGGAAGISNVKAPGNVAYNPADFGLSTADAHALDRSSTPILFQPDWSQAQIPGRNGLGTIKPAPSKGMPQVPGGLPFPQDTTLQGRDTLGGVGRARNPPNTIDTYGYKSASLARRATRRVPTGAYIPIGSKAHCPLAR